MNLEPFDDPQPYRVPDDLHARVVTAGRRRRLRRRLAAGGATLAVLLIAGVAGAVAIVNRRIDDIDRMRVTGLAEKPETPDDPYTVLFVGTDDATGLAPEDPVADPNRPTGGRFDTIVLARVEPATNQVRLLTVPRDLWIDRLDRKINAVGASGDSGDWPSGPTVSALVEVLDEDLGVAVDRVVVSDFAGAVAIGDILGVRVDFVTPVRDLRSGLVLDAGCTQLDGRQLLALGRSRHLFEQASNGDWMPDPTADLGRIERMPVLATAGIAALSRIDSSSPSQLNRLLDAAVDHLTLDDRTGRDDLIAMLRDLAGAQITPYELPVTGATIDGAAVLQSESASAAETVDRWTTGGSPTAAGERGGMPLLAVVPTPC